MSRLFDLLPARLRLGLDFELEHITEPQKATDRIWSTYRGISWPVDLGEVGCFQGIDPGVARAAAEFLKKEGFLTDAGYGMRGFKYYVRSTKTYVAPRIPKSKWPIFRPSQEDYTDYINSFEHEEDNA